MEMTLRLATMLFLGLMVAGQSEYCVQDDSPNGCISQSSGLLQHHQGSTVQLPMSEEDEDAAAVSHTQFKAQVEASFAAAKQTSQRALLLIEQDLASLHSSFDGAFDPTKSCNENAAASFDEFAANSSLSAELDAVELENFKERVVEEMFAFCKHEIDSIVELELQASTFHSRFSRSLQEAKPVLTKKLAALTTAAAQGFTVVLTDALMNLSALDLQHRTGKIQEEDEHKNVSSLMQTETTISQAKQRALPAAFDSRERWPACKDTIGRIHNQGTCGSCWAFGALSSIDSRLCIATDGVFSGAMLSRGFATSCGGPGGCKGASSSRAFKLLASSGVPTGGATGCSPYFGHGQGTDHFGADAAAPPCPTECGNSAFLRSLHQDTFKLPSLSKYVELQSLGSSNPTMVYQLAREAIMNSGPIPSGIYADGPFMGYTGGVYEHSCNTKANHETTTIGWGKDGKDYWLVLNSWGPGWGEQGSFRVALCVLTDFTVPRHAFASQSSGYSFPLAGGTATPAPNTGTPWTLEDNKLGGLYGLSKKGCSCSKLCANSDNDAGGDWCFVLDQVCQGSNWGYCNKPVPATTPPPAAPTTTPTTTTTTSTTTTTTTATTQPPPKPPNAKPWSLQSGPCSVDQVGCIMSPGYDADKGTLYGNAQACVFSVNSAAVIEAQDFNTEADYDILVVDSLKYSGSKSPHQKTPSASITWSSDGSLANSGWKLCPKVAPAAKTKKDCECKNGPWSYSGVTIQGSCGNPDGDSGGDWCLVKDKACEGGATWGYCAQ